MTVEAPSAAAPLELRAEDWPVRDAGTTLRVLGAWWTDVLDGVEDAQLLRAPGTRTPSVRGCLEACVAALGDASTGEVDVPALVAAVDRAAGAHAQRLLGPARAAVDPDAAAALAMDAVAPLVAACATLRDLGLRAPATAGEVVQLAASGGGVPKNPVQVAEIGHRGLAGDRQRAKEHHGRVWQALCLWSAEVIEALQAEGHPIGFGSAGENVTVRGLDWPAIRLGDRVSA